MEKGKKRLAEAGVRAVSLTDFDEIVAVAEAEGYIPAQSVPGLMAFRADPSDELSLIHISSTPAPRSSSAPASCRRPLSAPPP